MANFFDGFFRDFYHSTKAGKATFPRIDEIPYYFTWPLTVFLNKLNIHPIRIVFSSMLFGVLFLVLLVSNHPLFHTALPSTILLLRILLDYTDGQLARHSNKTSNLGALYDLVADFIFTLLLFGSIAFCLIARDSISAWLAIPVCILAFFSNVITATTASFTVRLSTNEHNSQEDAAQEFICHFANDYPSDLVYAKKIHYLNLIFHYSWRFISVVLFSLLIRNIRFRNYMAASHLFSIFANSMHLFVLIIFMMLDASLLYFCFYEILLFGLHCLFLLFYKLFSVR
ncbi:CDP-alcohol phosphatidyltransferase family protein [bacterium]|nr:CDP-alcohol phosphatidyltransferase family protein [bacterium]